MKKFKIYCLKSPINKEIRYVGVTSNDLKSRLAQHIYEAKHKNTYKSKWIFSLLKNECKPEIELLEEVDANQWESKEKEWIKNLYEKGCDLTNQREGGKGVFIDRDISGKERSRRSKFKKVYQFSIDMKFIKEWESPCVVANILNISRDSICHCCNKRYITNPTAGGYRWFYKIDYDSGKFLIKNRLPKEESKSCKKVYVYDINYNLIYIENSKANCAIKFNIPRHTLDRKLKKGDFTVGNKILSLNKSNDTNK